jgi:hypothetical protein
MKRKFHQHFYGEFNLFKFLFRWKFPILIELLTKKWAIKDENPDELQGLRVAEKEEVTFHLLI